MHDDALLHAVREHFNEPASSGFVMPDFLHKFGSPLEIWMYMSVVWPKACVLDEMVFLEDLATVNVSADAIRALLVACGGDRSEVERRANHIEVAQLFGARRGDATDELDASLADCLATIWSAKLASEHPTRSFVVRVLPPDNTADEIAITVYQDRR